MNLIPDKQAEEITSTKEVPAFFQEALVSDGAAKVFNAYQKKKDGSRLTYAAVKMDDSVEAFLKSEKSTGLKVKLVYDLAYQQYAILASDDASLELGFHLWTLHLINSK